ncbi:MAG: CoA transferase [Actinomycetia bacterium]|nr:CoA transferase [Actinomycetes bacterium]
METPHDPTRPLRPRVLDLSTGIAGGYCAKLLGDAGADVVKLEPPGGDPLRAHSASGAQVDATEGGLLFQYLHSGHRSAVADLTTTEGRDLARGLAAGADLVLETFEPGVVESLGLGPDALHAANPATTLVSVSSFGRGGPWSNRPATEFTLQAWCGSLNGRGIPGQAPVGAGGSIGDYMAGSAAASAGVAAWFAARRSGRGQHVDVSTLEAMLLSFVSYQPIFAQFDPGPHGRSIEIPSIEPAKDGWVGFCTVTRQQWSDFTAMIERPDFGDDVALNYAGNRMGRIEEIRGAIAAWAKDRTVDEIVELASLFRIPVSPVGNGHTVLEMDHFVERGVYGPHPGGFLQPRRPYRLGAYPDPEVRPAPRLGEHQAAIEAEVPAPTAHPGAPVPAVAPRPLEGVKVVGFVAFWAGPFVASYLAALGADVVKIESIQRPDGMRFAGGVKLDDPQFYEWSGVSHGANAGVRAVTLDLDRPEGVALALQLVAQADVVVDNFSPRVLDRFGLGESDLRTVKPDLVMARMPAFGLDGPWRDRGGFAMTVEQASGLAWRTGWDDQPLVPRGPCDVLGAYHTVLGILAALEHRDATGEGLLVESPLAEAALNIAAEQVLEWTANGVLLGREGNRTIDAAPQGVYPSADDDRWVVLTVADDDQWAGLRAAMGDPAWAADPALATLAGRQAAHDAIDEHLSAWLGPQPVLDAVELLAAHGVPAAPTMDARRLNHLPQLAARGWFEAMDHPVAGTVLYESLPMAFSAMPRPIYRRPAPTLGQHNAEVLAELGLTEAEIAALAEDKLIGTRPAWL